jgi:hypothetical protein
VAYSMMKWPLLFSRFYETVKISGMILCHDFTKVQYLVLPEHYIFTTHNIYDIMNVTLLFLLILLY